MARPRSARLRFAIGALAAMAVVMIFIGAQIVSRRLFERAPGRATRLAPAKSRTLNPEPDQRRFRVTGIQGPVECRQGDRLYALQAGDLLTPRDILKTPPGARVILRRGETEIEVRENLEIEIGQLANETARVGVLRGDGDLTASVGGDGESLAIGANQTETVSEGRSRFVVALTENGKVSVQVEKGAVRFKARDREVRVAAGNESAAEPEQPPADPSPISDDLLLSVTWPEKAPGKASGELQGKTSPSARVTINGRTTPVRADGTFAAPVPAGAEKSAIEVESRDPLGRSRKLTGRVGGKAHAPKLEATGEELWKR